MMWETYPAALSMRGDLSITPHNPRRIKNKQRQALRDADPPLPPTRIKYLEALGTVADGRITLLIGSEALVRSSEGERQYRIRLDLDAGVADSDDNGTVLRNYVGYPILALMIKQGKLPYDPQLAEALKGIKWKTLNQRYKNYRKTEEEIKKKLKERGIEPSEIDNYIKLAEEKMRTIILSKP